MQQVSSPVNQNGKKEKSEDEGESTEEEEVRSS